VDGTVQWQNVTVEYNYDTNGRLTNAIGTGKFRSLDNGNETTGKIEQYYTIIQGQAKLILSLTDSKTVNADDSIQTQFMAVSYTYDATGLLTGATGKGNFVSEDIYGNKTEGVIYQGYVVLYGQAKLRSSTTESQTYNVDGSYNRQIMTVDYFYDSRGRLVDAIGTGVFWSMDPSTKSTTVGHIHQTYVIINGQAKLETSTTTSHTNNLDSSSQIQVLTVRYYYNDKGQLVDAKGYGTFTGNDGHGMITTGTITQEYDIVNGQAKMIRSTTVSQTYDSMAGNSRAPGYKGSYQTQTLTVEYLWNDKGHLVGASGHGTFWSDDGYGNITTGKISQSYAIILGQAKLTSSTTTSTTRNKDGSVQWQTLTVSYTYDSAGRLTGASGSGTFRSDDGHGNITTGTISQEYVIIHGQAKLSKSVTVSNTVNVDGSTQSQTLTVIYTYNERGFLTGASGSGTFSSDDGYGNVTTGTISQQYIIIRGQAKLASSTTTSNTVNKDGSTQTQTVTVTYSYDRTGQLVGAIGNGTFSANDGNGNITTGLLHQSYRIINGQAKLSTSTTHSNTVNKDGSTQTQSVTVVYQYNSNGVLTGAYGYGTFSSNDGHGNVTTGTITQTYAIYHGMAKLKTSTTNSHSKNTDGSWQTQTLTVTYDYNSRGQLTGASGYGTFHANDGHGMITIGTIRQEYKIIHGMAKLINTVVDSYTYDSMWNPENAQDTAAEVEGAYDRAQNRIDRADRTRNRRVRQAQERRNRQVRRAQQARRQAMRRADNARQRQRAQRQYNQRVNRANRQQARTVRQANKDFRQARAAAMKDYRNVARAAGPIGRAHMAMVAERNQSENTRDQRIHRSRQSRDARIRQARATARAKLRQADSRRERRHIRRERRQQIRQARRDHQAKVRQARRDHQQSSRAAGRSYNNIVDSAKFHSKNGPWQRQTVTTTYEYDENGKLIGASGSGTFTANDGFGNMTTGTITQTYAIYHGMAKMTSSTTVSDTKNIDGSTQHQVLVVNYSYDDNGVLTGASGSGWFSSNDGQGNITTGTITQDYKIIAGQAKLVRSTTESHTTNKDGSWQKQTLTVTYRYDASGRLTGAKGFGTFHGADGNGNKTSGTIRQTYVVIRGQAKLKTSTTTSDTVNKDGSTQHQVLTVTYQYDKTGTLIGARGEGRFTSDDGHGNITRGTINQTYVVINGQAKLLSSTTNSTTRNKDGSTQKQSLTVFYHYNARGVLVGANGYGTTEANDGHGNITTGTIYQTYQIIHGQAKLKTSTTTTHTRNKDGSWQNQTLTVTYQYNSNGELVDAKGSGTFTSNDGHGNITRGTIKQEYKIIHGQAKLQESTTKSVTRNRDGSTQRQTLTVTYQYDGNGVLTGAKGRGSFTSNDGHGNKTRGTIRQEYKIIHGQAKLKTSTTRSVTKNKDGSTQRQTLTVTYRYDGNGVLKGATGRGHFTSNDGHGNKTRGTIRQTYKIIHGQAKLKTSTTRSKTKNKDGSTQTQVLRVTYRYNRNGVLIDAKGRGHFKSNDGHGNITRGKIRQDYKIIHGQAKLHTSTTRSHTKNRDGSWQRQTLTVTYRYNGQGMLTGATGRGTFTSFDPGGKGKDTPSSRTTGSIKQEYKIIHGQAKLHTSVTTSETKSGGDTSHQTMTVIYEYNRKGVLVDARGHGTFRSSDGSRGTISQEYRIIHGQAKLTKSYTETHGSDGSHTKITRVYEYNKKGDLVSARGYGTITVPNGYGTITETYKIIHGQAKLLRSETNLTITSYHTQTVPVTSYAGSQSYSAVQKSGGHLYRNTYSRAVYQTTIYRQTYKVVSRVRTVTNYSYDKNGRVTGKNTDTDSWVVSTTLVSSVVVGSYTSYGAWQYAGGVKITAGYTQTASNTWVRSGGGVTDTINYNPSTGGYTHSQTEVRASAVAPGATETINREFVYNSEGICTSARGSGTISGGGYTGTIQENWSIVDGAPRLMSQTRDVYFTSQFTRESESPGGTVSGTRMAQRGDDLVEERTATPVTNRYLETYEVSHHQQFVTTFQYNSAGEMVGSNTEMTVNETSAPRLVSRQFLGSYASGPTRVVGRTVLSRGYDFEEGAGTGGANRWVRTDGNRTHVLEYDPDSGLYREQTLQTRGGLLGLVDRFLNAAGIPSGRLVDEKVYERVTVTDPRTGVEVEGYRMYDRVEGPNVGGHVEEAFGGYYRESNRTVITGADSEPDAVLIDAGEGRTAVFQLGEQEDGTVLRLDNDWTHLEAEGEVVSPITGNTFSKTKIYDLRDFGTGNLREIVPQEGGGSGEDVKGPDFDAAFQIYDRNGDSRTYSMDSAFNGQYETRGGWEQEEVYRTEVTTSGPVRTTTYTFENGYRVVRSQYLPTGQDSVTVYDNRNEVVRPDDQGRVTFDLGYGTGSTMTVYTRDFSENQTTDIVLSNGQQGSRREVNIRAGTMGITYRNADGTQSMRFYEGRVETRDYDAEGDLFEHRGRMFEGGEVVGALDRRVNAEGQMEVTNNWRMIDGRVYRFDHTIDGPGGHKGPIIMGRTTVATRTIEDGDQLTVTALGGDRFRIQLSKDNGEVAEMITRQPKNAPAPGQQQAEAPAWFTMNEARVADQLPQSKMARAFTGDVIDMRLSRNGVELGHVWLDDQGNFHGNKWDGQVITDQMRADINAGREHRGVELQLESIQWNGNELRITGVKLNAAGQVEETWILGARAVQPQVLSGWEAQYASGTNGLSTDFGFTVRENANGQQYMHILEGSRKLAGESIRPEMFRNHNSLAERNGIMWDVNSGFVRNGDLVLAGVSLNDRGQTVGWVGGSNGHIQASVNRAGEIQIDKQGTLFGRPIDVTSLRTEIRLAQDELSPGQSIGGVSINLQGEQFQLVGQVVGANGQATGDTLFVNFNLDTTYSPIGGWEAAYTGAPQAQTGAVVSGVAVTTNGGQDFAYLKLTANNQLQEITGTVNTGELGMVNDRVDTRIGEDANVILTSGGQVMAFTNTRIYTLEVGFTAEGEWDGNVAMDLLTDENGGFISASRINTDVGGGWETITPDTIDELDISDDHEAGNFDSFKQMVTQAMQSDSGYSWSLSGGQLSAFNAATGVQLAMTFAHKEGDFRGNALVHRAGQVIYQVSDGKVANQEVVTNINNAIRDAASGNMSDGLNGDPARMVLSMTGSGSVMFVDPTDPRQIYIADGANYDSARILEFRTDLEGNVYDWSIKVHNSWEGNVVELTGASSQIQEFVQTSRTTQITDFSFNNDESMYSISGARANGDTVTLNIKETLTDFDSNSQAHGADLHLENFQVTRVNSDGSTTTTTYKLEDGAVRVDGEPVTKRQIDSGIFEVSQPGEDTYTENLVGERVVQGDGGGYQYEDEGGGFLGMDLVDWAVGALVVVAVLAAPFTGGMSLGLAVTAVGAGLGAASLTHNLRTGNWGMAAVDALFLGLTFGMGGVIKSAVSSAWKGVRFGSLTGRVSQATSLVDDGVDAATALKQVGLTGGQTLSKAGITGADLMAGGRFALANGADDLVKLGLTSSDDFARLGLQGSSAVNFLKSMGVQGVRALGEVGIRSTDDLVRLGISGTDDLGRLGITGVDSMKAMGLTGINLGRVGVTNAGQLRTLNVVGDDIGRLGVRAGAGSGGALSATVGRNLIHGANAAGQVVGRFTVLDSMHRSAEAFGEGNIGEGFLFLGMAAIGMGSVEGAIAAVSRRLGIKGAAAAGWGASKAEYVLDAKNVSLLRRAATSGLVSGAAMGTISVGARQLVSLIEGHGLLSWQEAVSSFALGFTLGAAIGTFKHATGANVLQNLSLKGSAVMATQSVLGGLNFARLNFYGMGSAMTLLPAFHKQEDGSWGWSMPSWEKFKQSLSEEARVESAWSGFAMGAAFGVIGSFQPNLGGNTFVGRNLGINGRVSMLLKHSPVAGDILHTAYSIMAFSGMETLINYGIENSGLSRGAKDFLHDNSLLLSVLFMPTVGGLSTSGMRARLEISKGGEGRRSVSEQILSGNRTIELGDGRTITVKEADMPLLTREAFSAMREDARAAEVAEVRAFEAEVTTVGREIGQRVFDRSAYEVAREILTAEVGTKVDVSSVFGVEAKVTVTEALKTHTAEAAQRTLANPEALKPADASRRINEAQVRDMTQLTTETLRQSGDMNLLGSTSDMVRMELTFRGGRVEMRQEMISVEQLSALKGLEQAIRVEGGELAAAGRTISAEIKNFIEARSGEMKLDEFLKVAEDGAVEKLYQEVQGAKNGDKITIEVNGHKQSVTVTDTFRAKMERAFDQRADAYRSEHNLTTGRSQEILQEAGFTVEIKKNDQTGRFELKIKNAETGKTVTDTIQTRAAERTLAEYVELKNAQLDITDALNTNQNELQQAEVKVQNTEGLAREAAQAEVAVLRAEQKVLQLRAEEVNLRIQKLETGRDVSVALSQTRETLKLAEADLVASEVRFQHATFREQLASGRNLFDLTAELLGASPELLRKGDNLNTALLTERLEILSRATEKMELARLEHGGGSKQWAEAWVAMRAEQLMVGAVFEGRITSVEAARAAEGRMLIEARSERLPIDGTKLSLSSRDQQLLSQYERFLEGIFEQKNLGNFEEGFRNLERVSGQEFSFERFLASQGVKPAEINNIYSQAAAKVERIRAGEKEVTLTLEEAMVFTQRTLDDVLIRGADKEASPLTGQKEGITAEQMLAVYSFLSGKSIEMAAGGGKTEVALVYELMMSTIMGEKHNGIIITDSAVASSKYVDRSFAGSDYTGGRLASEFFGKEIVDGSALFREHNLAELARAIKDPNKIVVIDYASFGHAHNVWGKSREGNALRDALREINSMVVDEVQIGLSGQQAYISSGTGTPLAGSRAGMARKERIGELFNELNNIYNEWSGLSESSRPTLEQVRQNKADIYVTADGNYSYISNRVYDMLKEKGYTDREISSVLDGITKSVKFGERNAYSVETENGQLRPTGDDGHLQADSRISDVDYQIALGMKLNEVYNGARVKNSNGGTLSPLESALMKTERGKSEVENFVEIDRIELASTDRHTSLLEIFNKPNATILGMSATAQGRESLIRLGIGSELNVISSSRFNLRDFNIMGERAGLERLSDVLSSGSGLARKIEAEWNVMYASPDAAHRARVVDHLMSLGESKGSRAFEYRDAKGNTVKVESAEIQLVKLKSGEVIEILNIDPASFGKDGGVLNEIAKWAGTNGKQGRRVFVYNERGFVGTDWQGNFHQFVADPAFSLTETLGAQLQHRVERQVSGKAGERWQATRTLVVSEQGLARELANFREFARPEVIESLRNQWGEGTYADAQGIRLLDRFLSEGGLSRLEQASSVLSAREHGLDRQAKLDNRNLSRDIADFVSLKARVNEAVERSHGIEFVLSDTYRGRMLILNLKDLIADPLVAGTKDAEIIEGRLNELINQSGGGRNFRAQDGRILTYEEIARNVFDGVSQEALTVFKGLRNQVGEGRAQLVLDRLISEITGVRENYNSIEAAKGDSFSSARTIADIVAVGKNLSRAIISRFDYGSSKGQSVESALEGLPQQTANRMEGEIGRNSSFSHEVDGVRHLTSAGEKFVAAIKDITGSESLARALAGFLEGMDSASRPEWLADMDLNSALSTEAGRADFAYRAISFLNDSGSVDMSSSRAENEFAEVLHIGGFRNNGLLDDNRSTQDSLRDYREGGLTRLTLNDSGSSAEVREPSLPQLDIDRGQRGSRSDVDLGGASARNNRKASGIGYQGGPGYFSPVGAMRTQEKMQKVEDRSGKVQKWALKAEQTKRESAKEDKSGLKERFKSLVSKVYNNIPVIYSAIRLNMAERSLQRAQNEIFVNTMTSKVVSAEMIGTQLTAVLPLATAQVNRATGNMEFRITAPTMVRVHAFVQNLQASVPQADRVRALQWNKVSVSEFTQMMNEGKSVELVQKLRGMEPVDRKKTILTAINIVGSAAVVASLALTGGLGFTPMLLMAAPMANFFLSRKDQTKREGGMRETMTQMAESSKQFTSKAQLIGTAVGVVASVAAMAIGGGFDLGLLGKAAMGGGALATVAWTPAVWIKDSIGSFRAKRVDVDTKLFRYTEIKTQLPKQSTRLEQVTFNEHGNALFTSRIPQIFGLVAIKNMETTAPHQDLGTKRVSVVKEALRARETNPKALTAEQKSTAEQYDAFVATLPQMDALMMQHQLQGIHGNTLFSSAASKMLSHYVGDLGRIGEVRGLLQKAESFRPAPAPSVRETGVKTTPLMPKAPIAPKPMNMGGRVERPAGAVTARPDVSLPSPESVDVRETRHLRQSISKIRCRRRKTRTAGGSKRNGSPGRVRM
jgi:hypothetical protein